VRVLSDSIAASGVSSVCLDDVTSIREYLWKEISRTGSDDRVRDVVFVMSNGSFDGLNEALQKDLVGG
jgi:hypothetical protein